MQLKFLLITLMIITAEGTQAQNAAPYWSLGGNSNATPSSKLGTSNYTPLLLKTNNLSRIYISPDGKIGIGTTSPTTQFHVEGQTLLNIFVNTVVPGLQSGSGLIGYVKGTPTAAGQRLGYFLMGSQGGGTNPYNATGMVGYADGAWSGTSRPAYIAFETTKPGTIQRSEAMHIGSNGYIGIGTSNPVNRLHVVDSSIAVYAEGRGSGSYGLYGIGGSIGVFGTGAYGLYGVGTTYGTYSFGSLYGVYANAFNSTGSSTGVRGNGTIGIYGYSSYDGGEGVYGTATGSLGYGGYFSSVSSYGICAVSSASSYAGYFQGNVYSTGTYQGSDKRLKKNITDFTDALSLIKKLKPKTYEYLTEGKLAEMNLPKGMHYGLIAQDLESVLPNLVKETIQEPLRDSTSKSGQVSAAGSTVSFKAVNYIELIPILVKAIQEQDADKEELKQKVQSQDQKMLQMEAEIQELKAMLTNTSGALSSAMLEVPVPNPAKGNTNIRYSIPAGTASARLTVVNILGQVMKEVKLNGGAGQVSLNVSNLAAGTYPCTLWVNGQQVISKQLVVAH